MRAIPLLLGLIYFLAVPVSVVVGGFEDERYTPRPAPNDFFAMQLHQTFPEDVRFVTDLGIGGIRAGSHFWVLLPRMGVLTFVPHFITRSTEVRLKAALDMLPCLTHAPDWAIAKNETWPKDDEPAKALEG